MHKQAVTDHRLREFWECDFRNVLIQTDVATLRGEKVNIFFQTFSKIRQIRYLSRLVVWPWLNTLPLRILSEEEGC